MSPVVKVNLSLYLIKYHIMDHMGKWRCRSMHSLPQH